ncbi:MAG: hypothetical protein WD939_10930 [Dehalococcoidia bacterium]
MRFLSGRSFVAVGVALMLAGLLVFSFAAPHTTLGQQTDVPPATQPDDVGSGAEGPAEPPASLPDTGTGGYLDDVGSAQLLLMVLLGALGVTLTGAGAIALRARRPSRYE